jgi:hypothetical protein
MSQVAPLVHSLRVSEPSDDHDRAREARIKALTAGQPDSVRFVPVSCPADQRGKT